MPNKISQPPVLAAIALAAALFASSCGKRANTAPKPQPPPPFEFLGSWGDKGQGPGKLDAPVSFAGDNLGNLFFADPAASFVHKFEANGTPLLSFEDPSLRRASGIAVDAGGAIYVSNAPAGTILVFFPDGTFFQAWHSAPERHFSGTLGVGIDEEGTLYAPDPANSRVLKFSNKGRLVKSWTAPPKPASPNERPSWICAEPDDALFVGYFSTGRIDKFAPDGTLMTSWSAAPAPANETSGESASAEAALSGMAANPDFVFTMAPASSEIRVWTKDGQHKLDADVGSGMGKVAAPQLAVTPHGELLVFDPSVPKIFRFRMHLKDQEAP